MNRHLTTCAFVGVLAIAGAACGSSSKAADTTPPTSGATAPGVSAAPDSGGATTTTVASGAKTGHVGDTLTDPDKFLASDVATVTLVKVIDPVTPTDAGNVADPGSRWVGLEMTFVDNGSNASDATDVARVTGSDGKDYDINADISENFTGCKSTMTDLQPNQKATFCPGFLLPKGVTVTKVGYTTRASDPSQPSDITWTVP